MKARNRIKPLLTLCCALLLVAAGVFGTLAYLTGTDTVNNTFTVGNVKITRLRQIRTALWLRALTV